MNIGQKRYLFNLIGSMAVISWLGLMGLLVVKKHMGSSPGAADFGSGRAAPVISSGREWMEIFLKGKKVGYSVNRVDPVGKDYLIQEEIFLKLNLMGRPSNLRTVTRALVDKAFVLRNFTFRMTSGVVAFKISGEVKGNRMQIQVGEGADHRKETIRLSAPPFLGPSMGPFFKGRALKEGQFFRFPVFDPSTLTQQELRLKVLGKGPLLLGSRTYDAFHLVGDMWGQTLSFWLDEEGNVLKEQGFMGLTLVRSGPAKAPLDIEGGHRDYYALAAIPVKRPLRDPDRVKYLRVKLDGLEKAHFDAAFLNRGRQRLRGKVLEVIQEKIPSRAPYRIPLKENSKELAPFLRPEWNIESDKEPILKKAHEITGTEKDPIEVARMHLAWVYRSLEKRPVITVPSALGVLRNRVGDCNEHAVLLTALLRASGIPARLCVGLVYARGRFFYHAWTEGYVGKWLSMDATMHQMPADATHIKLVQGGLDRQMAVIGLIGKLGLEVMGYRYD